MREAIGVKRRRGSRPRSSAWAAGLLGLFVLCGCHRDLRRLVESGRYEEAVAKAQEARFEPRKAAARAYAEALARTGRFDKARAVLLRDWRRGGEMQSLVALAALEEREGLHGTAAAHFARAVAIDPTRVQGRADACALLTERARMLAALGDALAAEADLERADRICPEPGPMGGAGAAPDAKAHQAVDRLADAEVEARIASTRCTENCEARDVPELAQRWDRARASGPQAVRALARELRASVQPELLLQLLVAELRGRLGVELMTDDELARLVGEQRWEELSSDVMARPAAQAAWIQLRLASVVPDMPVAPSPSVGPDQLDRWADRAVVVEGAQPWRVFLWRGELVETEFALASELRPPAAHPASEAEATDTDSASPAASPEKGASNSLSGHWMDRMPIDAEKLPAALLVTRLRHRAGAGALALELARVVLERSRAVQGSLDVARREVERALALGRPWWALALADAYGTDELEPQVAAASTALVLQQAVCGGPCGDDEDAEVVERVMGEAWVTSVRAAATGLAVARRRTSRDATVCPTLGELLGPDAVGPLPEALKSAAADADPAATTNALVRGIEADPVLACAGDIALPLLQRYGSGVAADALAELLSHAEIEASTQLAFLARLALVAGRQAQAQLWSRAAAAASTEPAKVWRSLARTARATGARELELQALRETLLHTPRLEAPDIRRELILAALRDVPTSWAASNLPHAGEAVVRQVEAYLDEHPDASRWWHRHRLLTELRRSDGMEVGNARAVADIVAPEGSTVRHTPVYRELVGEPVEGDPGSFAVEAAAVQARRGRLQELPAALAVGADVEQLEELRVALARHARSYEVRRRMALGLVAFGSLRARAIGASVLLEIAGAGARDDILRWLLEDPSVLQPTDDGALPALAFEDPDLLVRIAYGLDLAPAWVAR